ncbi:MAG: ABC transporter permease [Sphingobacteriales bacterium]|nr:ABC transporter permease [Sphingobacteriales bacterium]
MNHYNSEEETWDLEIKPKTSLFSLNLKEVWRYRDLMLLFVKRDFAAQYKQTILGPLWHVIQPILTTLMFLLIFGKIANIPTDGIPPVLFYMSGVTIWNYFSACLTATSSTFVANAGIFGKVYFPRLVLPLSIIFSNIARLGIQFGILVIAVLWYAVFKKNPVAFGSQWLLLPVLVMLMAGISLGLGIIISSLTTKYRDFSVLITFGIQLLMYATPVVYPLSFLSNKSYAWIIYRNPLSAVVEGFRFALFNTGSFVYSSLLYPFVFMIAVLLFGAMYFNKVERTFMDTV